jgi:hypothetical protein
MENFLEKKYKEYTDWWEYSDDSCNLTEEQSNMYLKLVDEGLQWAPLSQEEFINKIKTDDEFSKKWDIIIETREFDFEDRAMLSGQFNENTVRVDQFIETYGMRLLEQKLDEYNIPTKLTTIKYKNETIQIWETLINNTQTFCKTFLTTE